MKLFERKTCIKQYVRLMRQAGTPERSARGVAVGLFVGFFVPIGLQLIAAVPLAYLVRGNKMLAVLFTFISNPYTVTFFYPFQCWVGSVLLGNPLSYEELHGTFNRLFSSSSVGAVFLVGKEMGHELLVPFLFAGLLFGISAAAIGYFSTNWLISRFRNRKKRTS